MSPLAKLTFLILDDNANMASILRTVLKGFGVINVVEAADVGEAFERVRTQEIDFAFADINLPGMDGLAFVRLMRTAADSPAPFLPIVMLSAYSEGHRVASARDAGANDFLTKPVVPIEVYRKVLDAIERPRPFVRTAGFFGPDRRRRVDGAYAGPERREPAGSAAAAASA